MHFKELDVYKRSYKLALEVHGLSLTIKPLLQYDLGDQLRRASTSIVLNIAEGSGQPTKKGFALYIQRSKSSALECVACIKVALQEEFVLSVDTVTVEQLLETEYFKLVGLGKSMRV